MAILVRDRIKSAHWYTGDGYPMHEVLRSKEKDGEKYRSTTLSDARKLGLFPSVTGIMDDVLKKDQLERWKINQAIIATARTIRQENESVEYWCKRVIDAANQQVDDAADFGTMMHKSLDATVHDMSLERCAPEAIPYCKPVIDWFAQRNLNIVHKEKVVVNHQDGYAGTLDLAGTFTNSNGTFPFLFDYKTRKTKEGEEVKAYDYQICQIAAYAKVGWPDDFSQGRVYGGNLFISSTEPGRIKFVRYNPEELIEAYNIFRCAVTIWRYIKKYDPRRHEKNAQVSLVNNPDALIWGHQATSMPPAPAKEPERATDVRDTHPVMAPNSQNDGGSAGSAPLPVSVSTTHFREGMTNYVAISVNVGPNQVFYKTLAKFIKLDGVLLAIHRPIKKGPDQIPKLHKGKWWLTCPITGMGLGEVNEFKNPGNSQAEWLQHAGAWLSMKMEASALKFDAQYTKSLVGVPPAPDINTITHILE